MAYRVRESGEKPEGVSVPVYGITWETGEIPDVTPDRQALEDFVSRCNRSGVSPEFLPEVLDAFLG